jgi:hypothetical protein
MSLRSRARHLCLTVALAAVFIAFLGAGAHPASAHGDEGEIRETVVDQSGTNTVRVQIGLLYANDGDPAEDATATVMLAGPAGETVGPVTMPKTTGSRYAAEIEVPTTGTWSVAITTVEPEAEATATIEVTDQRAATTTADTAPGPEGGIVPQDPPPAVPGLAEDDDSFPWVVVIAAVIVAVVAVASFTYLRGRR